MAVASAGPYEDNLHLAPDTDNHIDTSSLMFTGQFFILALQPWFYTSFFILVSSHLILSLPTLLHGTGYNVLMCR